MHDKPLTKQEALHLYKVIRDTPVAVEPTEKEPEKKETKDGTQT
jgi:hypothetical protein